MSKLDRYLSREFAQNTFAVLVVLLIVLVGGAFADVLGDVARGKVPAGMLLAQLGLVFLKWLPLILPLAVMLGLMLAMGRLYRDAEMPVLVSIGVGPRRMLRPLAWMAVPVIAVVALCSLWLGPWADRTSARMIEEAGRNLLIAGMEPGRFTELPGGGGGVIYVGGMSPDNRELQRVFIYRQKEQRFDVTTSATGKLSVQASAQDQRDRYLRLEQGFEVEGPLSGDGRDYRLVRYAGNEVLLPADTNPRRRADEVALQPTSALLGMSGPQAVAQLHARLAPPLLTLGFALLAIPLSRSGPRQARYGNLAVGFLIYLFGVFLMMLGTQWLQDGKLPPAAGLWWLVLPILAAGVWMYARDGAIRRPRAVCTPSAGHA